MIQPEATLAERLCKAQSPHDLQDWEGRDGYYVAACRVSPADVPGLIAIAQGWSDVDRLNDEVGLDLDEDDVELLPVTAWRALADLQADAAVEPLIDLLRELDEFDDWVSGELPHVFGKIGESAILPLTRLATDSRAPEFARSVAARGLGCVAKYHAAARDRIVAGLTELMTNAVDCDVEFTTALLVELVDLQAVQAAEPIERAFAGNLVDVGMLGDWEMVRRKLGVEGLGLKMPDNPHNSIARLRIGMGLGIFSDDPIFSFSEINHAAVLAYYQRACDTFSGSSEAQRVIDRNGRLGWVRSFLEFGLDMRGEIVDAMTLDAVTEFLFDYAPRKISVEADAAGSIIFELTMFWEYVDRVYKLPEAKSIALWLKADDLISRLKAELSNPENFGMAKSMFMMGKSAGFDMTSEAGLAEFMAAYNQSLVSRRTPTPGAAMPRDRALKAPERVGRNDPCPCGSGKKFKKCCR